MPARTGRCFFGRGRARGTAHGREGEGVGAADAAGAKGSDAGTAGEAWGSRLMVEPNSELKFALGESRGRSTVEWFLDDFDGWYLVK